MSFKTFNVNQIALISAISNELTNQNPELPFETSLYNKIIEATNIIIEECNRERVYSKSGMKPDEWLNSDDIGLSSKYMLTVLANIGYPSPNGDTPSDADDLGRCIRMVEACDLESEMHLLLDMGESWKIIAENWDELKSLYKNEKFEEIYTFLQDRK